MVASASMVTGTLIMPWPRPWNRVATMMVSRAA